MSEKKVLKCGCGETKIFTCGPPKDHKCDSDGPWEWYLSNRATLSVFRQQIRRLSDHQ
jgi:hypothetical protein